MSTLTIEFVGRSMDYVHRQIELLEWARKTSDDETLFKHVELAIPILAQFMEGSETFQLFDHDSINRFVNDQNSGGTWAFIQGMQQYVFAGFSPSEVADIAKQLSFSVAPNKILTDDGVDTKSTGSDYSQSPTGTIAYDNTPDDILRFIKANPWIMPLVALGMSREIPTFEENPGDGK